MEGEEPGFAEGYALVDLFDDGSYECRYEPYGWVAPRSVDGTRLTTDQVSQRDRPLPMYGVVHFHTRRLWLCLP